LLDLAHHSDEVLAMFLALAGRRQSRIATKLVDARKRLADVLEEIDFLIGSRQSKR